MRASTGPSELAVRVGARTRAATRLRTLVVLTGGLRRRLSGGRGGGRGGVEARRGRGDGGGNLCKVGREGTAAAHASAAAKA